MKDFAEGLMKVANSASNFKMLGGDTMGELGMKMTAEIGGFSLISEHYDGEEKLMRRSTFQSADDVSIPAEEFKPPKEYKKKSMKEMIKR